MPFTEMLIEEVRKNDVLYNRNNVDFRKSEIKKRVWQDIAQKLGTTEEKCRSRWKGLRDTYRKAAKQEEIGRKNGTKYVKWKYFDNHKFLDDYMTIKIENSDDDNSKMEMILLNEDDMILSSANEESIPLSNEIFETTEENSNNSCLCKKQTICKEVNEKFCTLLENITNNLNSSNNILHKNSTTKLLESLALKITEANLPENIVLNLESKITELVYSTLIDHYNNQLC